MSSELFAYLAGAIDSDGSIGIRRKTDHVRIHKDAFNPTYGERIMLKQVTPQIPELLNELFGGSLGLGKGQSPNSKPLYRFECSHRRAVAACRALLPFLRVKRTQAEKALELRTLKATQFQQERYWFEIDYPNWRDMELITTSETMRLLRYANVGMVSQAIRLGSLLSTGARGHNAEAPKIPLRLVERILENGGMRATPRGLLARQEELYQAVRELNKIGINGTAIYRREGVYKPK